MYNRIKWMRAVCILLAMILSGCSDHAQSPVTTEPAFAPETEAVTETAPSEETEPAPETVPVVETEAVTETVPLEETAPAEPELPYLQRIPYADQSIFDGPGYDYCFAGTVKEAGTYTIVEEARDVEDNLWGRLKSGAGWVDLTDIRSEARQTEPLRANYADDRLLGSGNYHHFVGCTAEYAVSVAFRANEPLTDVTLWSMEFTETMELGEELFFLSRLEPDKPLVADLDFPGDMSTYAIRFTDSHGADRYFTVYISGRNGTLVLAETT